MAISVLLACASSSPVPVWQLTGLGYHWILYIWHANVRACRDTVMGDDIRGCSWESMARVQFLFTAAPKYAV